MTFSTAASLRSSSKSSVGEWTNSDVSKLLLVVLVLLVFNCSDLCFLRAGGSAAWRAAAGGSSMIVNCDLLARRGARYLACINSHEVQLANERT